MPAPDLPPVPVNDDPRAVYVHVSPGGVSEEALAGCTCVVVDVLRATTTIAEVLRAGALCVETFMTVEEVERARSSALDAGESCCRGGERGGVRIEGFELDNSPRTISRQQVGGRRVFFTTTNGTAALHLARRAARVVLAAFTNLSAVCRAVVGDARPIHVLCAGTRGEITLDDCLVAGAIVDRLSAARALSESDEGRLCLEAWRSACVQPGGVLRSLRLSRGGRNLERLGFDADVEYCAQIDLHDLVPEYDPATGRATARGVGAGSERVKG